MNEEINEKMIPSREEEEPESIAEASPEAAEETEVDELTALRQQLADAEAKAAEYLDGWQRARAEFANFKRRNDQEKKELISVANLALISRMLPVLDDLDRAFQTLPVGLRGMTWIDGIFIIHRKLQAILESEGLTPIETEGQVFDPSVHEAVTHEPIADYGEGKIISEVQRGYKLGDRVLRPSLVRVSAGPPSEEEPAGSDEALVEE
ncbi:MAG: nucleotide exchange factor GrpE [Chloroflexota bacterium]|nr:nucleotide exchange factor GrpE [Chloroflexota bacterium]